MKSRQSQYVAEAGARIKLVASSDAALRNQPVMIMPGHITYIRRTALASRDFGPPNRSHLPAFRLAEAGARIIGIGLAVALLVLLTLAYWHGE